MKYADRLKFTATGASSNTSASTLTITGAAPKCRTLAQALSDADNPLAVGDVNIAFCVTDNTGNWETGLYTLTSSTVLTRTRVMASSNNNAPVVFDGAGLTAFNTVVASQLQGITDPNDVGFDIVLCAGQSNMEGNPASDPLIDIGDGRVWQWSNTSTDASYRQIINGADPMYMPNGVRTGKTGPAAWFAKAYLASIPQNRKVLLVPVAVGSTAMVGDTWQPGSPGGTLYERAISDTNLAISAAQAWYPNSRFVGALWAQGEADGLNAIPQWQYAMNLKALIAGWRSRITGATNSWFIISSMTPEGQSAHPGEGPIDLAHKQVAAEVNKCVFVSPVSGMSSDVHYTSAGIRIMGSRMGLAANNARLAVGADTTAPTVVAASVANASPGSVSLTMSELIDSTSVPAGSAFAIANHTVNAAAISGNTMTLTLATPIANGETLTVVYTQPGTNPVKDMAGNLLASGASFAITNNVAAADTTAPTVSGAPTIANATPSVITITMSETLAAGNPPISAFTVTGTQTSISSVAVSGSTVSLTMAAAYLSGNTASVSYAPSGTNDLQDPSGNKTAAFGPLAVTNNVGAAGSTVTSVTVAPATATLAGAAQQTFTATVNGTNSPSQSVNWTADIGTITAGGVYTAPSATASAQTATITATSQQDNTKSGTATVTVSAAGTTYATISPTDKNAGLTLSNNNLTATSTTTGFISARGTVGKSTGKWYYEGKITAGTSAMFGFGGPNVSLASFAGADGTTGDSYGYYSTNGARYYVNANQGTLATFTTNDVIGVAVDLDAKTMQFFKNGVSLGSFTINTGGSPVYDPSATYPMITTNGNGVALLLNFGASAWAYAPPAGYNGWA